MPAPPRNSAILAGLVATSCLVAVACSDGRQTIRLPHDAAALRFIDVLPLAKLETPLPPPDPSSFETLLAGLPVRPVWAWQPDAGVETPAPAVENCVAARGDRPRRATLVCRRGFQVRARVPAEPGRPYRIRIQGQASKRDCVTLALGSETEFGSLVAVAAAPEAPETLAHVWTGPRDAALRVTLQPLGERRGCTLMLQGINVERVEATSEDRVRLARADGPLGGRDGGLGVAQAGYLLPHQVATAAPFDENSSYREALLAPTPSELRFSLRVPPTARLHFSFGFHRFAEPGDRATFEVVVKEAGLHRERSLFREELELAAGNWHWHEARVPLDELAGRTVELTLRTTSPDDGPVPVLWGAPRLDVRRRSEEPPNVLLVAVDTLRADHLSAYGSDVPTPRLDAFAREGVLFERAISPANWTLPAFVSLFTGLTPYRHGVLQALQAIAPPRVTLAEWLRDRGWVTGAVLYKPALGPGRNLEQGFERYFNVPLVQHRAERNVRKAAEWLADNADQRFFLFLHLNDPHQPFSQPPAFVEPRAVARLRELGLRLPFQVEAVVRRCPSCATDGKPSAAFRELVAELYAEEVRYVDEQFGILLQALAATGHAEDTLVIFLADHGEMLWDSWGSFNRFGHGGASFADLLTRVPLIVRPPRGTPFTPGSRVETPVSLVDVLPTVLDLVGIATDGLDGEGRSLRGLIEGSESYGDRGIVSAGPFGESLRTRDWRYLRTVGQGQTTGEYLFDLTADPRELVDVAGDHQGRLAALRAQLAEAAMTSQPGSVFIVATAAGASPALRIAVRGLGDCTAPRLAGFGIPRLTCDAGTVLFEGRAADSLALLAELPAAGDGSGLVAEAEVDGASLSAVSGPPQVYAAGDLANWLADGGAPALRLVRMPGEPDAGAAEAKGIDAGEIEALRALGYLDG